MARQPAKVVRSERFRSRRREVRKMNARRRRRVTITVVVLLALGTGGVVLAKSSLFDLEGIEVQGTQLLSRADVLQTSGLHTGQSMLSFKADQVKARIERLPLVREVKIARVPTNRIRITVLERTPAFVLETVESRWYLADDATVLEEVEGTVRALPRIRLDASVAADTGDQVRTRALIDALSLWRALPNQLRLGRPSIDATSTAGLTLVREEYDIRFGTLDQLEQKLEAVDLVMDRVRRSRDRILMLDVRSPYRPAAKLG
jgi:cell division septal protein FtsQ